MLTPPLFDDVMLHRGVQELTPRAVEDILQEQLSEHELSALVYRSHLHTRNVTEALLLQENLTPVLRNMLVRSSILQGGGAYDVVMFGGHIPPLELSMLVLVGYLWRHPDLRVYGETVAEILTLPTETQEIIRSLAQDAAKEGPVWDVPSLERVQKIIEIATTV